MASIIVGLSKPRLTRRLFFREAVGLERVQEEYVYPNSSSGFANSLVNGKSQSEIIGTVESDGGSYPTMVIERVEFQSLNGGLNLAIVTYVGLHTTQSPSPIISIEPILDNNWLFHKYAVIVRFVTSLGSPGSRSEISAVSSTYARGTIHTVINGTPIPQGVVGKANFLDLGTRSLNWNLGWISCPFSRESCGETSPIDEFEPTVQTLTPVKGGIYYQGFSVYGASVERFGLYGVIRLDIRDQAVYSIPGVIYACGDFPYQLQPCSSYLNTPASASQTTL